MRITDKAPTEPGPVFITHNVDQDLYMAWEYRGHLEDEDDGCRMKCDLEILDRYGELVDSEAEDAEQLGEFDAYRFRFIVITSDELDAARMASQMGAWEQWVTNLFDRERVS